MLDSTTLGTIQIFPFNQVPSGWMECDGRELPIARHQAVFALLGNRFGGDGQRTFRLPDLRGRVAVGAGPVIGHARQKGSERHALTSSEIPSHTHTLHGSGLGANTENVAGALPGTISSGTVAPYAPAATRGPLAPMAAEALAPMSNPWPHDNRQPYLAMVYAIAVEAIFPDRPSKGK